MFDPIDSRKESQDNVLGQALLAIGGIFLAGVIISNWSDDESTRETRSSEEDPKTIVRKKRYSNNTDQIYKVKVSGPSLQDQFHGVNSQNFTERKYPSNYYDLSKAQQYKYRRRMAKDSTE